MNININDIIDVIRLEKALDKTNRHLNVIDQKVKNLEIGKTNIAGISH